MAIKIKDLRLVDEVFLTSETYSQDQIDSAIPSTMDDIPDGVTYVKTENNYDNAAVSKLGGIAAGAEVNVNADWTALSGDAEILNKPTIPVISDDAYDATSWDNNLDGASKNALRDKFESLSAGSVPTSWGKYF